MKRYWEKSWWVACGLAIAGFLVYGYWPKPIRVDWVKVTRGAVVVTIDDDGETRIREKYTINAPVTGKLLRLQLHAGDAVRRNETELLQILPVVPSLLDARSRAESEARVRASEAAIEESEATLSSTRDATSLAQYQYERAQKLHQSNSISQAEFEEAEHRLRMAQAFLRSAEFRWKVKVHELDVARTALIRVTDSDENEHDTTMKIRSPIDGCVLRIMQEDSTVVLAGTAILEIGDPQDMEMQIDVLSVYAVGIEPGDRVIIEHWGGDHPLNGIVRIVEPSAFLKVSALGVEEKRVRVIADFIEPWDERKTLGDGFRIEARIVARTSEADGLKIPSGALFRLGEAWHVYRVRNGLSELTAVTVGESNGSETEIRHGLSLDDLVILHPSEQIKAGVRVAQAN